MRRVGAIIALAYLGCWMLWEGACWIGRQFRLGATPQQVADQINEVHD